MVLGLIVFSMLFIVFVVFGTLLMCGKGYFLISGYRSLSNEKKIEFVNKNNLKKVFQFYAYYCFAVALVTLVALIGVLLDSMGTIFICYLIFGTGTIATMIILNTNSTYKIVPVENATIIKSEPVVLPEREEAKKVEIIEDIDEKAVKEIIAEVEEKETEKKVEAPAKKSTTKKSTTSTNTTKPKTTSKSTTKSTVAKTTTKKNTNTENK